MANENVNIELVIQAGRSAQTLGEIKQSVKDVNEALKNVKVGSEEFDKLHEIFLKNRAAIKSMRQEFAGLKQIETIGKAATSSFAAATASISLFAGENEKLEKGLRKTAASLELMLAFKELAHSIREAQIANEGMNASLLTNPYVMLAVVILAVGAAFIKSADDSTELGSAINDLKDNSGGLSMVWTVLKEGVKGFVGSLVEGTAAVLKFTNALLGVKDNKAVREAFNQQVTIFKQSTEAVKNQSKAIEQDLEIQKSASTDKIKNAEAEIAAEKKKFELVKGYIEQGMKLYSERDKMDDDDKKKFDENYGELSSQFYELQTKIKVAENELAKTKLEDAREKALEVEKQQIKGVLEGYNDIETANKRVLEVMKARGDDEHKISKVNLEQNAMAAEYLREEIEQLNKKKTLDDNQKELLNELIKLQGELNQQKKVQEAEDEKRDADAAKKKELENIDLLKTKYEGLNKSLEGRVEALKADGETEDKVWVQQINNINRLTQVVQQNLVLIQQSNLADDEKAKKTEEWNVVLVGLQEQMQKVNAEMDGWNKKHVFTPEQQKEVTEFQKGLQTLGSFWGKISGLITQVTDQQSQKRIAIYENETKQAMGLLDKQLQYGYISQAQYNIKKAQLDSQLATEKRAEEVKAFKLKKEMSLVQAVIDTSLSVTEALSSVPPPAAYVMAAISAAMGAVEIGTIAAQQPPAMATGGLFTNGGSVSGYGGSTDDSVNAYLSNGEGVINARSTKAFAPLLSAINQIGGGVAFNGQPKLQPEHTGSAQSPSKQPDSAPQKVYVTESDITRTQNKVAVIQNRSSF